MIGVELHLCLSVLSFICKLHRTSEYMLYEDSFSFPHDQALEKYTLVVSIFLSHVHYRGEVTARIPTIKYIIQ